MIGLGRMGGNMAIRLVRGGHRVVAFNRTASVTQELAKENQPMDSAFSMQEIVD
ncbi:MAG TPA: NAD(P)-binding domain-containing protein, partial [Chloroflexota bacterium]|nr:NAD(P)-binding domain-containing protein [Chloroflexota bacterium]